MIQHFFKDLSLFMDVGSGFASVWKVGSGSASNKNQNPHPYPHQGDKSNPDPHPHQSDADPQHWQKSRKKVYFTDRMWYCFPARCRQRCNTRHSHSNNSSSCNSSSCNNSRESPHPIRIMPGCYSRDTTHHTYYRSKYFRNLYLFHGFCIKKRNIFEIFYEKTAFWWNWRILNSKLL